MKTTNEPSYSQAMDRLKEILKKIEEGKADIDELASLVEEAAELVSLCRKKLTQAEMQVKKITERLEREAEEPAPPPEEGDEEVPF